MARYHGRTLAEWYDIVTNRAIRFAQIVIAGRKLPHDRRSRDVVAAERDRLHVASDRACTRLVESVECMDRAREIFDEEMAAYRKRADAARRGHRNHKRRSAS